MDPNSNNTPPTPTETVAPVAPAPTPAFSQPISEDPGKTLGILSIVFSLFSGLIGLILGIIAKKKSKKAGFTNTLATVGIVLSIINIIIGLILAVIFTLSMVALVGKCNELGPGEHIEGGVTYTCG